MDIQNITKEQLETLVLIKAFEEIAKRREWCNEYEEPLENIYDVAFQFANDSLENLNEYEMFIRDIYNLTKAGYIESDANEEDIQLHNVPMIKGITQTGQAVIDNLEREFNQSSNKFEMFKKIFAAQYNRLKKIINMNTFTNIGNVLLMAVNVLNKVKELFHK